MAFTKDQIIEDVKEILLKLRERHPITAAYLFGSYARGAARDYSDVDIAVVLKTINKRGAFDEQFEIFHEMQEYNSLFEVVCFREDEFANGETMLAQHIRREGVRIL
jgi:predicted nucleotidyltransferase